MVLCDINSSCKVAQSSSKIPAKVVICEILQNKYFPEDTPGCSTSWKLRYYNDPCNIKSSCKIKQSFFDG